MSIEVPPIAIGSLVITPKMMGKIAMIPAKNRIWTPGRSRSGPRKKGLIFRKRNRIKRTGRRRKALLLMSPEIPKADKLLSRHRRRR